MTVGDVTVGDAAVAVGDVPVERMRMVEVVEAQIHDADTGIAKDIEGVMAPDMVHVVGDSSVAVGSPVHS